MRPARFGSPARGANSHGETVAGVFRSLRPRAALVFGRECFPRPGHVEIVLSHARTDNRRRSVSVGGDAQLQ
jgi:hypothetical protein